MADGVVTIETGLACNNHCAYCPQQILRSCRPGQGFTTDQLKRRVDAARRTGADEIAFTGGEPTLRRDFLEIVAFARVAGFRCVSVTTNGRMFAYADYAKRAIEAGLSGASVSLHGPDAATHEGLTGVAGSFDQAVAGLANLRRAAPTARGPFDLHSVTILVPQNLSRLRETLLLAGSLGATLHVVQPFIVSRENLHLSDAFLLTRDQIAEGLRVALEPGLPDRRRVKPFNIPPCLVAPLGDVIEQQRYKVRTVREYEDDAVPAAGRPRAVQFVRDIRCHGCNWQCPGFRLENQSDAEAAAGLAGDLGASLAVLPGREAMVCSTDLLRPAGLGTVLAGVVGAWSGPVRLMSGGFARASAAEVVGACRTAGINEICFVVQPASQRLPDRQAWLPGNLDAIRAYLDLLQPGALPRPSLLVQPAMLLTDDCEFDRDAWLDLAGRVGRAGGARVFLCAPERLEPMAEPWTDLFRSRLAEALPGWLQDLAAAGVEPELVHAPQPAGAPDPGPLERLVAAHVPVVDWRPTLARHRFVGTEFGWVMWSYPHWVLNEL